MGAACGCMKANEKEVKNAKGIVGTKGGVRIGGGEGPEGGDVAAARAAKFEQQRKENNNRGLTKESAIEL